MGINGNTHKMTNYLARFENIGDVINGDCTKIFNFNINFEEMYEILTKKDNYSDFYKSYISKFEELGDYTFSLFYSCLKENTFEFTSKPLVFGKKIIDWIYGLGEFPSKEIQAFYNDLKIDFNFDDNTVIVKRWNANISYFNSDVKLASENYSKLYDELLNCKNIPEWFLDDICIDGRNLLHQYENMINKISFDNKFQTRLSSNRHKLSYPDIDRIKSEIFENVSKNVFNNKNKSKYTTIYGVGLRDCFKNIQDLIFLTVFYGSITHLKLVRGLISNTMYMYADTFEGEGFYNLTLRMLFLGGEFKKYKKLYNKIILNNSFVVCEDFIKSIVDSRRALFNFEIEEKDIFLFDIYGKYFSEDLYLHFEKVIFEIITIKENFDINKVTNALLAIKNNIQRTKKISNLLDIMKEYFIKSYSRFYMEFSRILDEIDINKLSSTEFKKYQNIVDLLIKEDKNMQYDLSNCIIKIKKRNSKITKYDYLINKENTNENIAHQIEIENNELKAIKNIVNIYRERHNSREKNPGIFNDSINEYYIGTDIFSSKNYTKEVRDFILKEYLPLAQDIILSANEIIYEKIKHIQLLAYLLRVESDVTIKNNIINTIHESKKRKYYDHVGIDRRKQKNSDDLDTNIIMFDVIANKIMYEEALSIYIERAIRNQYCAEEILKCVITINDICKRVSKNCIEKLYFLFIIFYEQNDIDIRFYSIIMAKVFIGTRYQETIVKKLETRADHITTEECISYIQLIKESSKQKKTFSKIIERLTENSNYYVKNMINEYLINN